MRAQSRAVYALTICASVRRLARVQSWQNHAFVGGHLRFLRLDKMSPHKPYKPLYEPHRKLHTLRDKTAGTSDTWSRLQPVARLRVGCIEIPGNFDSPGPFFCSAGPFLHARDTNMS